MIRYVLCAIYYQVSNFLLRLILFMKCSTYSQRTHSNSWYKKTNCMNCANRNVRCRNPIRLNMIYTDAYKVIGGLFFGKMLDKSKWCCCQACGVACNKTISLECLIQEPQCLYPVCSHIRWPCVKLSFQASVAKDTIVAFRIGNYLTSLCDARDMWNGKS